MLRRLYKILLVLGIAGSLAAILLFWLFYRPTARLEADFLDVGQGDAILIKTPGGQNILIDGGPDKTIIKRLGENLPWYDKRIDLMILTHPHDDHVAGLIDVLKRYQVKKILSAGVSHSSPNYLAWLELARDKKVPVILADRPQRINLGKDCRLDIIYPEKSLVGLNVDNLNNSSIMAKLIYGRTKFLLTGDLEAAEESQLINGDLTADVLKVGHHGSDTSSSQDFLDNIKPSVAVIEVGRDNLFGHPNQRILKRLERAGVKIYRTDLHGTVKFLSDGDKIEKYPLD